MKVYPYICVAGPTKVIMFVRVYHVAIGTVAVVYVDSHLSHQNPKTRSITSPRYERVVVVLGQ